MSLFSARFNALKQPIWPAGGSSAVIFLFVLVALALILPLPTFEVTFKLEGTPGAPVQVFYSANNHFTEPKSVRLGAATVRVPGYARWLRIDLPEGEAFVVTQAAISYGMINAELFSSDTQYMVGSHSVVFSVAPGHVKGSANGPDPYIVFRLPQSLTFSIVATHLLISLFLAFIVVRVCCSRRANLMPISAWIQRWYRSSYAVVPIVAAGTFLRGRYFAHAPLPSSPADLWRMWPDEGTYFNLAQLISSKGIAAYFSSEASLMAPSLNVLYIWSMYEITGSVTALRHINIALSVATILLVYWLGKSLFGKGVGLAASAFVAVSAQFIRYSPTLLTEPLFLFLFFGSLLTLVNLTDQSAYRSRRLLLSSAFCTLAVMSRSILQLWPLFLLGLTVLWSFTRTSANGVVRYPSAIYVALVIPTLILSMLILKNYVFVGKPVVTTGSGAALWLGSRIDTEGDEPPYRGKSYDTGKILGETSHLSVAGDAKLFGEGVKNVKEHFWQYMFWNVKKIGRLVVGSNLAWFYPQKNLMEWKRSQGLTLIPVIGIIANVTLSVFVAVYGICGVMSESIDAKRLIVLGSVAYLILFSLPFLAIQRYGMPITPLLALYAGAYLQRTFAKPLTKTHVVVTAIGAFIVAYTLGLTALL